MFLYYFFTASHVEEIPQIGPAGGPQTVGQPSPGITNATYMVCPFNRKTKNTCKTRVTRLQYKRMCQEVFLTGQPQIRRGDQ